MSAFKEFKLKTPHTAAKKISGTRELGEFSKGGVAMPGASKILALPPLLGGAKIAAVVLHTMNIENQNNQKVRPKDRGGVSEDQKDQSVPTT